MNDKILKIGSGVIDKKIVRERIERICEAYLNKNNTIENKKELEKHLMKCLKELEE